MSEGTVRFLGGDLDMFVPSQVVRESQTDHLEGGTLWQLNITEAQGWMWAGGRVGVVPFGCEGVTVAEGGHILVGGDDEGELYKV